MSKKKVLFAVSEWGFGPISTLRVIGDKISDDVDIIFLGKSEHVKNFVRNNMPYIENIYSDPEEINFNNLHAVINCMDIMTLLYAKKYEIPVYMIDNLYFFWDWNETDEQHVINIVENESLTIQKRIDQLHGLPDYKGYMSFYILSKHIYLQCYTNIDKMFLEKYKHKIQFISPIIKKQKSNSKKKDKVLISLSGLITPVSTRLSIHLYMCFVKKIIESLPIKEETICILTTPKETLSVAVQVFSSTGIEVLAMSQDVFVKNLSESQLLLCPSGFSTTFEALYYKTGIIFLPEFHDGNIFNYHAMADFYVESYSELNRVYPNYHLNTFGDYEYKSIEDINSHYLDLLCNLDYNETLGKMTEKIIYALDSGQKLYLNQKQYWEKKYTEFNGEDIIIQRLLS